MRVEIEKTIRFHEIAAASWFLPGRRTSAQTFEINSRPRVPYASVETRRFPILRSENNEEIARTMAESMASSIEYSSIARRIFHTEILELGEVPLYETDNGRIHVNTEMISSRSRIGDDVLLDIQGRVALLSTARSRLISSIQESEDIRAFEILRLACEGVQRVPNVTVATANLAAARQTAVSIVAHPQDLTTLLKDAGGSFNGRTRVDETPSFGTIYGADLYVSSFARRGTAYMMGPPNQTGIIAIRRPIEVIIRRSEENHSIDVTAFEDLGMSILNRSSVVPIFVEAS